MYAFFTFPLFLGLFVLVLNLLTHLGEHGIDHDADDADDAGPSVLSVKVIAAFLASFGAVGLLASYGGHGAVGSSVWGVVGGVAIAGVMFALLTALYRQQANSHLNVEALLGATAMVTVEIKPDNFGEIIVSRRGQQQTFLAMYFAPAAAPPLKPGSIVTIESFSGPHAVVRPAQQIATR